MIIIVSGEPYQASQFVNRLKEQKINEGFGYYFFDFERSEKQGSRSGSYAEDAGEEVEKNILGSLRGQSLFKKNKIIQIRISDFPFIERFLEEYSGKVGDDILIFFAPSQKRFMFHASDFTIRHFEIPKGEDLKTFIGGEFLDRGVKADHRRTQFFMHNLYRLPSLYPIVNEIEKITLAPAYEKELLTLGNSLTPFSLTDALTRKDISGALRILEKQFRQGEKPFDILNRIIWQFRVLLLVSGSYQLPPHQSPEQIPSELYGAGKLGTGQAAISYQLNFHPFVIKKAREALRFFSPKELKNLYLKAISLYGEILFSSLPSKLLLFRFFWQI